MFVACDDEAVAAWADSVGAEVLWTPGLGLNGAVESSRTTISGKGFDHLLIAHSDLPLAGDLTDAGDGGDDHASSPIAPAAARTCSACRSRRRSRCSYGAGSFDAHLSQAMALAGDRQLALRVEVRRDPRLALDVDTPDDLAHPALRTELPGWLQTILASRR